MSGELHRDRSTIGLAGAVAISGLVQSLLYGSAFDPISFVAAPSRFSRSP